MPLAVCNFEKKQMFGIFKKKDPVAALQKKYEILMGDYHKLSTTNRALSDQKYAEAQRIAEQIEALQAEI